MSAYTQPASVYTHAAYKLAQCIRAARECSRNSWLHAHNKTERTEYLRMKAEAMADARYWLNLTRSPRP